jgi:phosphosulfolactate phosphohydrolase-like enzyme
MQPFPEWVIFHVPHDSKVIPAEVRHQFALDDVALMQEIIKMTDHHTPSCSLAAFLSSKLLDHLSAG